MATLMSTTSDAIFTLPAGDETVRMVQRLEEALECKVKVTFAPFIESKCCLAFDLPKHLHVSARIFIRAYREGARDGVDRHLGSAYTCIPGGL